MSQFDLTSIDTSLHYREVFYNNDNELQYDNIKISSRVDSLQNLIWLRDGRWFFWLDKNMNEVNKSNKKAKFYILVNFVEDTVFSKVYFFDLKNKLIKTLKVYPEFNGEIFEGDLTCFYDKKERLKKVKIEKHNDYSLSYYNEINYRRNRKLKSIFHYNEETGVSWTSKNNFKGECKKDMYFDKNHGVKISSLNFLNRMKVKLYDEENVIIDYFVKGELIKSKEVPK